MKHQLQIKRSYAPEEETDGRRILVDRLWPRGESRTRADLSEWDRQIAPDPQLRKAFHQNELSFEEFSRRYVDQLSHSPEAAQFAQHVETLLEDTNVTLLFGSKNETENNAAVLKDWLLDTMNQKQEKKS